MLAVLCFLGSGAVASAANDNPSNKAKYSKLDAKYDDEIRFHYKQVDARWICDDRGSKSDHDFTCYGPTPDGSSYTVGHFGIGNSHDGPKPNVYQVSVTGISAEAVFAKPLGFFNIWEDHGSHGDDNWGLWQVNCPNGFRALSDVCVNGYHQPSNDEIWCINEDFLDDDYHDDWIWDDKGSGADANCDINGGQSLYTNDLVAATNQRGSKKYLSKIKDEY